MFYEILSGTTDVVIFMQNLDKYYKNCSYVYSTIKINIESPVKMVFLPDIP